MSENRPRHRLDIAPSDERRAIDRHQERMPLVDQPGPEDTALLQRRPFEEADIGPLARHHVDAMRGARDVGERAGTNVGHR